MSLSINLYLLGVNKMDKTELTQLKKDLRIAGSITRTSKDEALENIQLKIKKNELEIIASDSYRLFSTKHQTDLGYQTGKYYLHFKEVADFVKKLGADEKLPKLKQGLKYPNVNVIKRPAKSNILVETDGLRTTLTMIKKMFEEVYSGVKQSKAHFRIKRGKMIIWAKNDETKIKNELALKGNSKIKYKHFVANAEYMLSLLNQQEITAIGYDNQNLPLLVNNHCLMVVDTKNK